MNQMEVYFYKRRFFHIVNEITHSNLTQHELKSSVENIEFE